MLSNKLTFSLVLVLMFAFVATSAFGQVIAPITIDPDPGEKGFTVVAKSLAGADANTAGANHGIVRLTPTDATTTGVQVEADLTDLDVLLRSGGEIDLVLSVGMKPVPPAPATTTIVSDIETVGFVGDEVTRISTITPAAAATFKHRLIISEIMWGRNRTTANPTGGVTAQWIEVYNHGGALKADDALTLRFSRTRTVNQVGDVIVVTPVSGNTPAVYGVIVDKVSIVTDFGGTWALVGNSGNTEAIFGTDNPTGAIQPTPLVSMYRKVNLMAGKYKETDKADPATGRKGLDGLGAGTAGDSWAASAGRINIIGQFIGSPGSVHVSTGGLATTFAKSPAAVPPTTNLGTDAAPKNLDPGSGVIINEVRNDTSGANLDWIELFNNTDPAPAGVTSTNVENWELSIVTRTPKAGKTEADDPTKANFDYLDEVQVVLPTYKLAPGEYMVIYNRDPGQTGLAGGVSIDDVADQTQVNKGASHVYTVSADLNLPSDKKFLIILRDGDEKEGTHEKVRDFAGNGYFTRQEPNEFDTEVWPFVGWTAPIDTVDVGVNDTFASADQSWGRKTELGHAVGDADPTVAATRASTQLNRGVYWPKGREGNRMHKDDWLSFEYMGTGYDRAADGRSSPGTPGYPNVAINLISHDRDGAAKHTAYAFGGAVTISEVMYDAGPRWNLVQWIELYNSSMSETINLEGWRLEIRNKEDVESYVDSSFDFEAGAKILPNQTILLVSGAGTNDVDADRVYNLYQHHRRELGLLARDSILLSRTGFYLNLKAKFTEGGRTVLKMVDEAGNVSVTGAQRNVMWALPTRDPAARQSLIRQYGSRVIDGTPDAADIGTMETSWKQSDISGAGLSYYGHRNDIGTPGFRLGGPLPVSLSSFRPVRNQTTGHVDITWITQSELNNAGFNILRSEGKGHAFEVINVKGIVAGHGTTSEKHVYKYTDTTAKPNVVYYYQIEDVSLNGNRTTLRTTHLRGNVSAGGKLTTRWSELKASGK